MNTRHAMLIPNIGPLQRRKRLLLGLINFGIGAAIALVLILTGAERVLRLVLFLPYLSGMIGVFQTVDQTCTALARRGTRNLDSGEEIIQNRVELERIRQQARMIYVKAALAAAALTAAVLLLPI